VQRSLTQSFALYAEITTTFASTGVSEWSVAVAGGALLQIAKSVQHDYEVQRGLNRRATDWTHVFRVNWEWQVLLRKGAGPQIQANSASLHSHAPDQVLTLQRDPPLYVRSMSRRVKTPGLLHRALAAMCAALVLTLTLLAASPSAHSWLHSGVSSHKCPEHAKSQPAPNTAEHDCAVVLFAGGVDTPVAAVALIPPRVVVQSVSPVTAAEFYLVSPRYLRQPERGPPSSRFA
jgi:hypothetical protein